MATIKNEFDYIQEARSQLAKALVNKFGVREQDILNADGSIKSTGLWASNSDGSKNYLKRLHDWAVLITATNVHTEASLTFKNDGNGDEVGTTFNGSVAKSISYNSIGAAPVGHTHTAKIETSTDTSQIALAYGGKYKLTAGGTTYVFTMPSSNNTWRPIGTGANDAAAGNHVHKNLIIKWGTGNTEGTDLFTYNGSTAKTIDLSIPIGQLFTRFENADTGFKTTNITATIGGINRSFEVNWATYAGRAQTADSWTTARTLTIGSTGKSVNGSENVSWTLAEIGASASSHTHSVKINGTIKTIAAPGGTSVDLGSYLPLTGGTMTGVINFSNTNARLAFGNLEKSPIKGYNAPQLSTPGVGIYSRYGGGSDEGAIIITEDTCVIYNSADTGWNFQVMDTDLGKDMSQPATRSFGVNQDHQAWSLSGFVKSGSSDSYVLLGGGGHKAVSSFATSEHTHSYLPLSGGTLTGNLTLSNSSLIVGSHIYESKASNSNLVFQTWMQDSTKKVYQFGYAAQVIGFGNAWSEMTSEVFYLKGYIHTAGYMRIKDIKLQFNSSNNTLNLNGASGQTVNLAVTGTVKAEDIEAAGTIYAQCVDATDIFTYDIKVYNDAYFDQSIYAQHFYENSDIRYKKILKNLSINSNIIANLPLFDFEWIENNSIGTGTSAQAVQQILPNLVSGTDKLTLDYGVLGTIAGVTACKELVTQKSELQQLKEKVKQLEDKLRKYENI